MVTWIFNIYRHDILKMLSRLYKMNMKVLLVRNQSLLYYGNGLSPEKYIHIILFVIHLFSHYMITHCNKYSFYYVLKQ